MKDNALIIWTPNGCWLQQTVGGVIRSSWFGHHPMWAVQDWAQRRGIRFCTHSAGVEWKGDKEFQKQLEAA